MRSLVAVGQVLGKRQDDSAGVACSEVPEPGLVLDRLSGRGVDQGRRVTALTPEFLRGRGSLHR